jgi:hypothetical protein
MGILLARAIFANQNNPRHQSFRHIVGYFLGRPYKVRQDD